MPDIFSMFNLNYESPQPGSKKSGRVPDSAPSAEELCNRLVLLTRAMWELMSSRLNISEQELLDKVTEIDLRDGKLDGKMEAKTACCGACGRHLSQRHATCIYCGAPIAASSAFDPVSGD